MWGVAIPGLGYLAHAPKALNSPKDKLVLTDLFWIANGMDTIFDFTKI